MGTIAYNLLNYENGVINGILGMLGMEPVNIYANGPAWRIIIVIFNAWKSVGYSMVVYLAAVTGVDMQLHESAKIDGANRWQLLKSVILPMLMPTITICTFLTLTNGFKLFDQNLALTGGNPGKMSELLALNIYNTMYGTTGWQGVGQAKAVIFFIIVAIIALAQNKITTSKEVQD